MGVVFFKNCDKPVPYRQHLLGNKTGPLKDYEAVYSYQTIIKQNVLLNSVQSRSNDCNTSM